jgi:dihydroxy-acid dehydratase
MLPPDALVKHGVKQLATIGDGRQSGTSDSPSILNASPEAAVGGGLALLITGDSVRVDLNARTVDVLLSDEELAARRETMRVAPAVPQSPWQELYQKHVGQLGEGGVLEFAVKYQDIGKEIPRHSH